MILQQIRQKWPILTLPVFALPASVCYHRIQTDDPYITFRYARNLFDGHGLVYNAGEQVLGTTAPLFALLLAALSWTTGNYPLLTSLINGCALAVMALLAHRLASMMGEPRAGLPAGLLLVLNPLLGDVFGMELNLFLALILGAYVAYFTGRFKSSALLLALGVLTRGDGLLPAFLIFIHCLWKERRFPLAPALLFSAVVGAWTLYASLTFGSPFPNTLAAKQAMGESGLWRPYWYGGLRILGLYLQQTPLYLWFGLAAILGGWRVARGDRRLVLLAGWWVLLFLGYTAMGIPSAANYFAAFAPLLMMLSGVGVVQLGDWVRSRFHVRAGWAVAVLPLLFTVPLVGAELIPILARVAGNPDGRYWTYREAGEWLDRNTLPGSSVGLVEIGIVGYYSDRAIVDVCGLIDPAVGPHLAVGDVSWPIRTYRPDYVMLHDPPWASLEGPTADAAWFKEQYRLVRRFDGERPYELALYQREPLPTP